LNIPPVIRIKLIKSKYQINKPTINTLIDYAIQGNRKYETNPTVNGAIHIDHSISYSLNCRFRSLDKKYLKLSILRPITFSYYNLMGRLTIGLHIK